MNAVEIEEAVSTLSAAPYTASEFPYDFLAAFGMKDVTLKRLRSGTSNASDIPGAVLQRNNIHLAAAPPGQTPATLAALRASPKTTAAKARFILATDGDMVEAEAIASGESLACPYADLARHFAFFLPLAGISTIAELKNNPIDIKATGRLNKLYVELLRTNPDWATEAKRPTLNRFMARLIFCFFAEDTGIFHGSYPFTQTVDRMSEATSANTHEIIGKLFEAMGTKPEARRDARFPAWADGFPYVNGDLFTGDGDCPRFSKIARAYLLAAGNLDWKEINPDIFGSMIQAVADDEERGALGMHYTSVPNILKVLNPLFLDDLREQLEAAGTNARKLRNLRRRLATIRVFDPACGSGNFLVIAYLKMREIEAEIVRRTGDEAKSAIRLINFYGIEIKGFAAEIARLALLIAEFQADCRYISQQEARSMVLPLHKTGQIHVGNALRLDWLAICPPLSKAVVEEHDLGGPTGYLALGTDGLTDGYKPPTYVCGNPPYKGSQAQKSEQKADLERLFNKVEKRWPSLDYISGWFFRASRFLIIVDGSAAFVSTNSISQGEQVPLLWPLVFSAGHKITFCHTSFGWANLAASNAGVTVVVIGFSNYHTSLCKLFESSGDGSFTIREVKNINPYLVSAEDIVVQAVSQTPRDRSLMLKGNQPTDGGHLCLTLLERDNLAARAPEAGRFIRRYVGSQEFIRGEQRFCIWVEDSEQHKALEIAPLAERFRDVTKFREASVAATTRPYAAVPHRFRQIQSVAKYTSIVIPSVSSERRAYLPVGILGEGSIVSNLAFALYDAPLWNMALIASRIHLVWIATVCGKLKTDFRYSNTLGWNTFPVPTLTEQQKTDLTRCAENILLAREAHFPATIADLYDPDDMPENLRQAHEANDDTLERIYIGRRFRNDTERLEKLFELYTAMTAAPKPPKKKPGRAA